MWIGADAEQRGHEPRTRRPTDTAARGRLLCRLAPAGAAEIENATGHSAIPRGVRGGWWGELDGPVEVVHVTQGLIQLNNYGVIAIISIWIRRRALYSYHVAKAAPSTRAVGCSGASARAGPAGPTGLSFGRRISDAVSDYLYGAETHRTLPAQSARITLTLLSDWFYSEEDQVVVADRDDVPHGHGM